MVFTASDTHDRALVPLPLKPLVPKVLEPQQLAHPAPRLGGGIRAYCASKLCNVLTARAFADLDEVRALDIRVIAYNPGLTLGTNLGRSGSDRQGPAKSPNAVVRALFGLASRFDDVFYPGTPERAGEALAQLALGAVRPPAGRVYASLVRGELTFPDPSKLALNDRARDTLWRESANMVGLSPR